MILSFPRKRESIPFEARRCVFPVNITPLITNWDRLADSAKSVAMAALPDCLYPHIRTQRFGDDHAAVGLLVVLQDRDQNARQSQSGAVQGVDIPGLFTQLRPVAYISPAGLKIAAIAA